MGIMIISGDLKDKDKVVVDVENGELKSEVIMV
jgi:hypothetical protein